MIPVGLERMRKTVSVDLLDHREHEPLFVLVHKTLVNAVYLANYCLYTLPSGTTLQARHCSRLFSPRLIWTLHLFLDDIVLDPS